MWKKKPGPPRKGRDKQGRFTAGHKLQYPRAIPPNSGQFQPGQLPVPSRRRHPGDTYWCKRTNEMFVCVPEPHPYFPHRPHHFKPRRIANFEKVHGPVPQGCVVMRLLTDRSNDKPSNLILIRRAALLILNSGKWSINRTRFNDLPNNRELRLSAVSMAAIKAGPPYVLLPGAEPGPANVAAARATPRPQEQGKDDRTA